MKSCGRCRDTYLCRTQCKFNFPSLMNSVPRPTVIQLFPNSPMNVSSPSRTHTIYITRVTPLTNITSKHSVTDIPEFPLFPCFKRAARFYDSAYEFREHMHQLTTVIRLLRNSPMNVSDSSRKHKHTSRVLCLSRNIKFPSFPWIKTGQGFPIRPIRRRSFASSIRCGRISEIDGENFTIRGTQRS